MKTETRNLQQTDAAHHIHPFSDSKILNKVGSKIIKKAHGVWIWDTEGNKILDGMAGLWCVNIGYGRDELAEVASNQIKELPYYNLFFQTSHPKATELAALIGEITPDHMHHVFFTCSGSEANDTNLRYVRHYWASLGQPDKNIIISRNNSYHGSTVAAASLGGMKPMHAQGGLPIPNIAHIQEPYWYQEGGDLSPDEFGIKAARALEEKILELGEDRVAAFIAEPVQGAGGVIVPPDSYWPEVQKILNKYNILFICDEVICGFGRTGNWFGCETYNLKPDLMTIAKGMSSGYAPMGAVVLSEKVADVLINKGGELTHGYTYSGHPLSAAISIKNIQILQQEKMVEKVRNESAPYLQKRWLELNQYELVGETRGVGMLAAIELVKDKNTRTRFPENLKVGKMCVKICGENNLVMRSVANSMVVSPPLCISIEEIDMLMDRAHAIVQQLTKVLKEEGHLN